MIDMSAARLITIGFCLTTVGCANAEKPHVQSEATTAEYGPLLANAADGQLPVDAKDDQGRPLVITAVIYGTDDQLQRMLEEGFDPNVAYSGVPALHFAVTDACQEHKLETLVNAGANVHEPDEILDSTALHHAAQHRNTACLGILAEAKADVDTQDGQGRTAYFYAVDQGSRPAVEMLWNLGADPTIPANDGLDIFKYAIASDKSEFVKPLVFKLAD